MLQCIFIKYLLNFTFTENRIETKLNPPFACFTMTSFCIYNNLSLTSWGRSNVYHNDYNISFYSCVSCIYQSTHLDQVKIIIIIFVCVCVCVCVIYVYSTIILFHIISDAGWLRLPITFAIPAVRRLRCLPCYTPTSFPNPIQVLDLLLLSVPFLSPRYTHARARAVPSLPHPSALVAAEYAPLYCKGHGGAGC